MVAMKALQLSAANNARKCLADSTPSPEIPERGMI
jgi:hypothetical protein